jgi:hypothetical protein
MEQQLKTKLDQELICPQAFLQNSDRKIIINDDGVNPANFFNFDANTANNLYFHSILRIPESHSIRPDIGSFTKHLTQTQKPISRISEFSAQTVASVAKPSPLFVCPDATTRPSQNSDVSNFDESHSKHKSISRVSFRPIVKEIDPATLIEDSGSEHLEDFECSMEESDQAEKLGAYENFGKMPLTFLSRMKSVTINDDKKKAIVLRRFVDKLQNRNANFKIYTCDICNKNFNNHAALGGHKAKNHPHSSKSFIERKKTFELRKSERKKRDFLRNF